MGRELMCTLVGICGVLMVFSFITNSVSKRRKLVMLLMSLIAMLLVIADRLAYYFNGVEGVKSFYIVRISKFWVYLMFLTIIFVFNQYLRDLFIDYGEMQKELKRIEIIVFLGVTVLVISQFTGLYYTYDENNMYHRSRLYCMSYIIPLTALMLQLICIAKNRNKIRKTMLIPLLLFTTMPVLASIVQFFVHGVALTSTSIISMVVLLYSISIIDTNKLLETAHKKEIDMLLEKQRNISLMVSQTAFALAEAIDAKDKYTNGHSKRVAEYSKKIAIAAGKTEEECEEIYLAALLHDVGKIGIPGAIISKEGKLTDEEYDVIKTHPVIGKNILSKIKNAKYLRVGAHYHHERYDGKGYPKGLANVQIPEIARIIAVADAYDAMTSKRSYRDSLSQEAVREQIDKGRGKQFDPVFAEIMLKFIDEDKNYEMRQVL